MPVCPMCQGNEVRCHYCNGSRQDPETDVEPEYSSGCDRCGRPLIMGHRATYQSGLCDMCYTDDRDEARERENAGDRRP